jgi:5-methylcytosine-specific restriction enzyme A
MTGKLTLTQNPRWTKDETILALDLYLRRRPQLPSKADPEIIALSEKLNLWAAKRGVLGKNNFRNAAGVAMKLGNLRRLDKDLGLAGLGNGSKLEEIVWSEFHNTPDKLLEAIRRIEADIRRV